MASGAIENFIGALLGGLSQACASLAGKVMIGLGFGIAVFSGYDATMGWLLTQCSNNLKLLPPDVVGILKTCKVDSAISMIGSAFTVRALLNGMSPTGVISRWVMKG